MRLDLRLINLTGARRLESSKTKFFLVVAHFSRVDALFAFCLKYKYMVILCIDYRDGCVKKGLITVIIN